MPGRARYGWMGEGRGMGDGGWGVHCRALMTWQQMGRRASWRGRPSAARVSSACGTQPLCRPLPLAVSNGGPAQRLRRRPQTTRTPPHSSRRKRQRREERPLHDNGNDRARRRRARCRGHGRWRRGRLHREASLKGRASYARPHLRDLLRSLLPSLWEHRADAEAGAGAARLDAQGWVGELGRIRASRLRRVLAHPRAPGGER